VAAAKLCPSVTANEKRKIPMNELTVRSEATDISPFRAFADENLASAIAGDLLVFNKGVWERGESKTQVAADARFLCNMHELWTGWVRWFDRKPVEYQISRVIDRAPKILREELGHMDKNVWETYTNGSPRDPWAKTDRLILGELGTDQLLTFSTSSDGGRDAIAKLCRTYDRGAKRHGGAWPVVKLEDAPYAHQLYGIVHKPSLKVVDWAFWEGEEPEPPKAVSFANDLNDSIPFAPETRG
jgi:hypothetical protein